MGAFDFAFHARHWVGLATVVILIVQWQVVDLDRRQREVGWRHFGKRGCKLLVERFFSQTSDENGDFILGH